MKAIKEFIEYNLGLTLRGEAEIILGGYLNEGFRVDTDQGEIFIRRRQRGSLSETSDLGAEYNLQCDLFKAGARVAEPLGVNDGLMALRFLGGISDPRQILHWAEQEAKGDFLLQQFGEALGSIHSMTFQEMPYLRTFRLENRWQEMRAALDELPGHYPILEWAIRQLEARMPKSADIVLAHRDFRLGNMLINEKSGALLAIIDWEFAGLSDPYEDLGWFCARCWRFGRAAEAAGLGSKDVFLRAYQSVRATEIDLPRLNYWENLAALRWAIIALQQGERYRRGDIKNIDLALTPLRALEACYDLLMDLTDA